MGKSKGLSTHRLNQMRWTLNIIKDYWVKEVKLSIRLIKSHKSCVPEKERKEDLNANSRPEKQHNCMKSDNSGSMFRFKTKSLLKFQKEIEFFLNKSFP